jgi:hypothetical protein
VKATTRLLEQTAWSQVEWLNEHGANHVRRGAFNTLRPVAPVATNPAAA